MNSMFLNTFPITFFIMPLLVCGHSWIERAYVFNDNELIGIPGYARGYVPRTTGFLDADMTYLLPRQGEVAITSDDFMCKETQRTYNETLESPRLSAHAGDLVLLMYLENGHVTKLDVNHNSSGIVQIYGTLTPSNSDKFQDITGGLQTSVYGLLQTTDFDDGHCYEDNGSPIALERRALPQRAHLDAEGSNLWCGSTVQIPMYLGQGSIYTLYWVWYFDTPATTQIYTTCMDIDIIA